MTAYDGTSIAWQITNHFQKERRKSLRTPMNKAFTAMPCLEHHKFFNNYEC